MSPDQQITARQFLVDVEYKLLQRFFLYSHHYYGDVKMTEEQWLKAYQVWRKLIGLPVLQDVSEESKIRKRIRSV